MKIISLLLGIYLMALTLMPCSDAHQIQQNSTTSISSFNHHPHDNRIDLCSPFCGCSCCGNSLIFRISNIEPIADYTLFFITTYNSSTQTHKEYSYHNHIWQPPRFI